MSWPGPRGLPYHAAPNGRAAATAWAPPTLTHGRRRRGEPDAPMDHIDSLSSSARGPATERTRDHRYEALVTTIRAAKQARQESWREMAQSLRRIKEERLWEGRGFATFDRWAWGTVRLDSRQVTALLGVAAEPIGSTGRRPGPKPGRTNGRLVPAGPADARASPDHEVEAIHESGITSTSLAELSIGIATEAASGRRALGWAARQLGQLEQLGAARWRAGLTEAERTAAGRELTRLSALFARCARLVTGAAPADPVPHEEETT